MQREVLSAISDLKTNVANLGTVNLQNIDESLTYFDQKYKSELFKEGIEILVYQNDSLKYWSGNVFSAPDILDSTWVSSALIQNGSGYYLATSQRKKFNINVIGVQLLKYNYKYSNEYLPKGYYGKFSANKNIDLKLVPGPHNVKDSNGKFLFSLIFNQSREIETWLMYLLLAIYLASLLLFIHALFLAYLFIVSKLETKWILFPAFIFDVFFIRVLQFYFKFPTELYQLNLFGPSYYASSYWLPSLGDLLIDVLVLLQLAFYYYKYSSVKSPDLKKNKPSGNLGHSIVLTGIIAMLFYISSSTIEGLVSNSNISFSFDNILIIKAISHVSMLIIAGLALSVFFLANIAGFYAVKYALHWHNYFIEAFLWTGLYSLFSYYHNQFEIIYTGLFLLFFGVLYFQNKDEKFYRFKFASVFSGIIVLGIIATLVINKSETEREKNQRKLIAIHLSQSRDNLAEYFYNESIKGIQKDKHILDLISSAKSDSAFTALSNGIKRTYFSGYFRKLQVQITVCPPGKKLIINPDNIVTDCESYFDTNIKQFMQPVSGNGLYYLRQAVDAMYYVGKITIKKPQDSTHLLCNIFVEINSADVWRGLGYPELLIDRTKTSVDNLYGYSYAFYKKGELVKHVGKYSYDLSPWEFHNKENIKYIDLNGYNHLIYNVDRDTRIVLSKENPRLFDSFSPFSYLLLLMLLLLLIIRLIFKELMTVHMSINTFRGRLQFSMVAVIVLSSLALVGVSLLFINKINTNKNNEILTEKLNSALVDLESRYRSFPSFENVSKYELTELLLNLSNTYFTDINLFDTKGYLLASSRDQIYKEGMISEQMNPSGIKQLIVDKKSFIIQRENIGSYTFLSTYAPVRNADNKLLGYINLPYFARQEEIRSEISGLISAFANIYIIMIIVTVLLALLLSRYITLPLKHIGLQFSRIKLGNQNAKIEWNRKDEIGQLIGEYNRMIDEMERSAEILARSERESAWRLMARQVAHEIKNPLTPIKLSMQLLLRAWQDQAPDWDARLKRFSQTLIMQIDTLSSIATEFSDFATMPKPEIRDFDIVPLLQQSVALFHDHSDCEIIFKSELTACVVKADPSQMLRVFNNLIKNALQALSNERQGRIEISMKLQENECLIGFKDNGNGIPVEKQSRIFSPNFTTKSTGMGLGLAMVKNIMDGLGGNIWFETEPGIGSTFYISLPVEGLIKS